jgi:membrane protein DedA with SNARE-associated domain
VLIGRVIPLVRTFISFPAGMAEMQPGIFGIYTAIGVAIWVSLFSWLGYHFGGQYHKYTKGVSYAGYLVAAAVVALVAFGIWHRYRSLKHGGSPRNRHVKR